MNFILQIVHEGGGAGTVDDPVIERECELGSLLECETCRCRNGCIEDFAEGQGCGGGSDDGWDPKPHAGRSDVRHADRDRRVRLIDPLSRQLDLCVELVEKLAARQRIGGSDHRGYERVTGECDCDPKVDMAVGSKDRTVGAETGPKLRMTLERFRNTPQHHREARLSTPRFLDGLACLVERGPIDLGHHRHGNRGLDAADQSVIQGNLLLGDRGLIELGISDRVGIEGMASVGSLSFDSRMAGF